MFIEVLVAGCSGLIVAGLGTIANSYYTNKRNSEKIAELKEENAKQNNEAQAMAIRAKDELEDKASVKDLEKLEHKVYQHFAEGKEVLQRLTRIETILERIEKNGKSH